jgi:hypothetical protein
VKYLLMIYMNDAAFEALSEEEREALMAGHDEFHAQRGGNLRPLGRRERQLESRAARLAADDR